MRPHLLHFTSLNEAFDDLTIMPPCLAMPVKQLRYDDSRHYHDWKHLARIWDTWRAYSNSQHEGSPLDLTIRVATAYHDFIYLPGAPRGENEARSAMALTQYALPHLLAGNWMQAVRLAIDCTNATADHLTYKGAHPFVLQFLDLDLYSLCLRWDEFVVNNRNIRREMLHLDKERFRDGQISFLERLLYAPNIYASDLLPRWCELAARQNIGQAIHRLEKHVCEWVDAEDK